jgi:hypothetical protein
MIVYIVGGGLLLLLLALIVPLILVKVWKEDESTVNQDDTVEPPQPINPVATLVNEAPEEENKFSKLSTPPTMQEVQENTQPNMNPQVPKEKAGGDIKKKIIEAKQKAKERETEIYSSDDTVPTTTMQSEEAPDPTEDLQILYNKIQQSQETDENEREEPEE